jgi:predicted nucleic acid-binding protein
MTTTAGKRTFLDTNVLLRAHFQDMPNHSEAGHAVNIQQQNGAELWISRQVIREFMVQASHRKFVPVPLNAVQLEAEIQTLRRLYTVADDTDAVTTQLIALLKEFPTGGKQIHDANIVATMLVNGVDTLLTINIADMKRFTSKITVLSPLPSR